MRGTPADPVAETLRTLDRDRYFSTLILKEPKRTAVQALYAANAEIAAVGERVSEPMPGEIRLQWWADLVSGEAHGAAAQNPVAAALLDVMARYRLPAAALQRLTAARRFDLYQDPMPDIATFEGYAGETTSVPLHLSATILNDGAPPENGEVAGHLGVALALFGHMRAFGFNAARGRLFLPLDVFVAEDVGEAEIFALRNSSAMQAAIARCQALGMDHLAKARAALRDLPRALRPAFAQLAMIDTRAGRGADPFAPPLQGNDWLKLLRLMWFAMTLR